MKKLGYQKNAQRKKFIATKADKWEVTDIANSSEDISALNGNKQAKSSQKKLLKEKFTAETKVSRLENILKDSDNGSFKRKNIKKQAPSSNFAEIEDQKVKSSASKKRKNTSKDSNVEVEALKPDIDMDTLEHEIDIKAKKIKKKKMLIQRSEASRDISEFNLTEVGKEKIKLTELIKTLKKSTGHLLAKNQLPNATDFKSLTVPLEKPQLEKIKRTVAYEKTCDEVTKWDPVIKANRSAPQLVFPLKQPEFRLDTIDNVARQFVTKNELEEEVSKLLNNSENVVDGKRTLTVAEEKALQAMSLEEAKARHGELMKHRALMSYQEAKARRQNKIKSKRYHRILKKEKLKSKMKEFEALQKSDPAAAIEKFLEADNLRILERMTLKHRNTGKWAQLQKLRAKYNPESRSFLKEDLAIGKKFREKLPEEERIHLFSKERRDEIEEPELELFESSTTHKDFISGRMDGASHSNSDEEPSDSESENLESQKKESVVENAVKQIMNSLSTETHEWTSKPETNGKIVPVENDVGFSSELTFLDSMVPDEVTLGDEEENSPEGVINIRQAFADEGFVAEFREEKKTAEEANKPKGIDLHLPGWGDWGGPDIKDSGTKRKRFFIEPPELPQKKNTLGSVIINEDKDKKAAEHQVSQLPFPFTSVHQFENYIRQPIGNTWNPETSFQKMIAPRIVTKTGKIIEPIDAEDVVLEKKREHRPSKFVKQKMESTVRKAF